MKDIKADPAFADRVRSAVFWRSGSQIFAQFVLWSVTLIVVRLLEPSDYGLFAMTQVVSVIFAVFNGSGFASAGNGSTPHPTGGGNGLKNLRARAQELGGELQLDSAPGKGTRLTLQVPL